MRVCKNASKQLVKVAKVWYARIQGCKHVIMQVQVFKYESMQVCKYAGICMFIYKVYARFFLLQH